MTQSWFLDFNIIKYRINIMLFSKVPMYERLLVTGNQLAFEYVSVLIKCLFSHSLLSVMTH